MVSGTTSSFQHLDWVKTTDYLNMRKTAGLEGALIRELNPGTSLYIWDPIPVEKDGYTWWQVLDATNPTEPFGWVSGHRLERYALWLVPDELLPHYATVDTGEQVTLASNNTLLLEALCPDCGGIEGGTLTVTPTTATTTTAPEPYGGQNPMYVGLVQNPGEGTDQFLARVARMRRALGWGQM